MVFLLFENLERVSVSLLMLSAKQGKHWYPFFTVFGMTQPLLGIGPWTSRSLPLGYRGGDTNYK